MGKDNGIAFAFIDLGHLLTVDRHVRFLAERRVSHPD